MKPFLGIDLTENKKNDKQNGQEFLVATPSLAMEQALKSTTEKAEETLTRSKLPTILRFAQWISGTAAALVTLGIVKGLVKPDGVSISEAYKNAPALFYIAIGGFVIWLILKLLSMQKEKTVLETDESVQILSNVEGVHDGIFKELGVPASAVAVDVLFFYYKVKNEKMKVCERGMQFAPYFMPEFQAFSDSENLYLVNLEGKYAFPLTSLQRIRTVNKHIRIGGWNKDIGPKDGIYKQYKMTVDQYGCVHCKQYCKLEFSHKNEQWGIYFPCYELSKFEAITNMHALPADD